MVLTQEDMDENIGSCYTAVSSCSSEEWWWNDKYRFGDGRQMLNRIYVKSSLVSVLVSSSVKLTTKEMEEHGLNPRCAAVATLECQGTRVTVASFHLSGGYVDDGVVAGQISGDAESWMKNIREVQLTTLRNAMASNTSASNVVMGGDSNGFPMSQAQPCQAKHVDDIAQKRSWGDAAKKQYMQYITIPETISGDCRRLQHKMKQQHSGSEICSDAAMSTSAWGGQVDTFYTNVNSAESKVLPIGLTNAEERPFGRRLSDHNPILLKMSMGGKDAATTFQSIHKEGLSLVREHAPEADIGSVRVERKIAPPEDRSGTSRGPGHPGALLFWIICLSIPALALAAYLSATRP